MREVAEVYRGWSAGPGLAADRDVAGEHKALAEAATARDADTACALLANHIQLTTDLLLDAVVDSAS
jgi:DNA-binding GntR family transcriptional regulator